VGDDIDGVNTSDRAGPIAMSSNGNIIAVGSPKNDIGGNNAGQTRIFQFSTTWSQRGTGIPGEVDEDEAGTSVALSANGDIVAVGSPKNADGADRGGQVRVWEWNGMSWSKKGTDIESTKGKRFFGTSVALTPNGDILAVGGPGKLNQGKKGYVGVWSFGTDWVQVHGNINGGVDEYFGTSVAITSDGAAVVIGAIGTTNGSVYVFTDDGNNWVSASGEIAGEFANDNFGQSVALKLDGSSYILAVGAPNHSSGAGRVYVYESMNLNTWSQLGNNVDGAISGDLAGSAVALSTDGAILAVGYPGNNNGYTLVFQFDVGTLSWVQVNDKIVGENSGDLSGEYVALSSDGGVIAIGAKENDSKTGHVRVHENACN